jgi:hypothetical protein
VEIPFPTVTEKGMASVHQNQSEAGCFFGHRSGNLVSGKFTITMHLLLTPEIF